MSLSLVVLATVREIARAKHFQRVAPLRADTASAEKPTRPNVPGPHSRIIPIH
jgi:hypothetical protein